MKLTIEQLQAIKAKAIENGYVDNANGEHRLGMRNLICDTFSQDDYIETSDEAVRKLALGLALFCYDKRGKGYAGIKGEILERRDNLKHLKVKSWFKHTMDEADFTYNKRKAEKKTGCGAWMYSHGTLAEARAELENSGNYIVWDYDHEPEDGAKNDNPIHIHIACTWRQFFRYLDTYCNGWETFFKYNKNKSITAQINVYEMNTLKTSRKKIAFLENAEF